jgi:hypothetical protein
MAQGGAAHCIDPMYVPAEARAQLAMCPGGGGLCVPDELIRGDAYTPRTCASIGGDPGACASRCIPLIEENEGILPQAGCAASERCAPCINPLDGMPTGICDPRPARECTGEPEPDVPPPPPPPPPMTCCGGRATCVTASVVPADRRENLGQDSCAAGLLCIPNEFIADPMHRPEPCFDDLAAFFGGDGRGACMSECFPQIADSDFLSEADCPSGYKCAPCTDPFSGAPTGVCP